MFYPVEVNGGFFTIFFAVNAQCTSVGPRVGMVSLWPLVGDFTYNMKGSHFFRASTQGMVSMTLSVICSTKCLRNVLTSVVVLLFGIVDLSGHS